MTWQPPDIAALNSRLASQNQRVRHYLEGVIGRLDRLIDAALANDWESVRRWSLEISQCGEAREEADIVRSAESVLEAASRAENETELKRRVMKLIAACGKAQGAAKMP
jgi:hypothetical protein